MNEREERGPGGEKKAEDTEEEKRLKEATEMEKSG